MPNIRFVSIEEDPDLFPGSLDDVRDNPGRLLDLSQLARIGVVVSYDGAKKLPPPLSMPSGRRTWEGRTILRAIGADLELPDNAKAKAAVDPPAAAKESIEPPA